MLRNMNEKKGNEQQIQYLNKCHDLDKSMANYGGKRVSTSDNMVNVFGDTPNDTSSFVGKKSM